METDIKIIAQRLNRLRNSNTEMETEAFDLVPELTGGLGNTGNEFYGTKVSSFTGSAILIHNPMEGDWTKALLIPESEFGNDGTSDLERVEEALEWLRNSILK